MLSGPSRTLTLLVVGALFVTLALPAVEADHAYSHRYVVYGRVVDANGLPVTSTQVEVGVDPAIRELIEGLCDPRQRDTGTAAWDATVTQTETNAYGEFIYCFHAHNMPRSTDAKIRAKAGGVEVESDVDTQFRRSFVTITLPGDNGTETTEFTSTYLVMGRAMFPSSKRTVENVGVYGDTFQHEPVTVTYTTASGETVTEETITNSYGDFAVRLNVTSAMGAGKVTVDVAGESATQDANLQSRVSDFHIEGTNPNLVKESLFKFGPLAVLVLIVGAGVFMFLGGGKQTTGKKKGKR